MSAKAAKAMLGGTTRLTVSRTSKPLDEALTTSAEAGAAKRIARPARYFMRAKMPRSGRSVQNRVDLRGDLIDRGHAVNAADETALLIVGQDRLGLGAIFGHARAHRLLVVIGTALELGRSADVADAGNRGLLELVMVGSATASAGEAADDAPNELVLVDGDLDHMVEAATALGQQQVERLRLGAGAREAIEDRALPRRGVEPLPDQRADDCIADQLAALHHRFG